MLDGLRQGLAGPVARFVDAFLLPHRTGNLVTDVLLWLSIGAAAGVLALLVTFRTVPKTSWQWLGAVLVGVCGGWLGGFVANLLGLETVNWLGSLVVAFAGAVGIIALIRRTRPTRG